MDKLLNLSELEMDALREIGNVGAGNAATTLSKFLGKNIIMHMPDTKFIPIKDFASELGGPERIVSSIYLQILGDLNGEVVFIFSREGALELIDILTGEQCGSTKLISEFGESAFKEMSNVLAGSFLNALSKMLDVKIVPSIPHVATDMVQSVIDFILIKVSEHAETILSIRTKIDIEGHDLKGAFLVFFDHASLTTMLGILHNKYG